MSGLPKLSNSQKYTNPRKDSISEMSSPSKSLGNKKSSSQFSNSSNQKEKPKSVYESQQWLEWITNLFNKYDKDHDFRLLSNEVSQLLADQGKVLPHKSIIKLMKDFQGDAPNKQIKVSGLIGIAKQLQIQQSQKGGQKNGDAMTHLYSDLFKKYDTDNDGKLTANDLYPLLVGNGVSNADHKYCQRLVKTYSTDAPNQLLESDFFKLAQSIKLGVQPQNDEDKGKNKDTYDEFIGGLFMKYDIRNSGKLYNGDLYMLLHDYGFPEIKPEDVEKYISKYQDDVQDGHIKISGFRKLAKKLKIKYVDEDAQLKENEELDDRSEENIENLFGRYDFHADGKLFAPQLYLMLHEHGMPHISTRQVEALVEKYQDDAQDDHVQLVGFRKLIKDLMINVPDLDDTKNEESNDSSESGDGDDK